MLKSRRKKKEREDKLRLEREEQEREEKLRREKDAREREEQQRLMRERQAQRAQEQASLLGQAQPSQHPPSMHGPPNGFHPPPSNGIPPPQGLRQAPGGLPPGRVSMAPSPQGPASSSPSTTTTTTSPYGQGQQPGYPPSHPHPHTSSQPPPPQQQQQQQQQVPSGPPGQPRPNGVPGPRPPPAYPWSARQLQKEVPFPRCDYTVIGYGEDAYLFGGLGRSGPRNDLVIIHTGTLAATTVSTGGEIPMPRDGHTAVLVDRAMIVFGGECDDGKCEDSVFHLDLDSRTWQRLHMQGPIPTGRRDHAAVQAGSIMYMFGGQTNGYFLDDLMSFDTRTLQITEPGLPPIPRWEHVEISSMGGAVAPSRRAGHTLSVYEDKLYVFGGTDGEKFFNEMWCYDLHTREWSLVEAQGHTPPGRAGHAACVVDGCIYVTGGKSATGRNLSDVVAFRIRSLRWYTFGNMGPAPAARSGHSMLSHGSKVYVFNGEAREGEDPRGVHVLDAGKIKYPAEKGPRPVTQGGLPSNMANRNQPTTNSSQPGGPMREARRETMPAPMTGPSSINNPLSSPQLPSSSPQQQQSLPSSIQPHPSGSIPSQNQSLSATSPSPSSPSPSSVPNSRPGTGQSASSMGARSPLQAQTSTTIPNRSTMTGPSPGPGPRPSSRDTPPPRTPPQGTSDPASSSSPSSHPRPGGPGGLRQNSRSPMGPQPASRSNSQTSQLSSTAPSLDAVSHPNSGPTPMGSPPTGGITRPPRSKNRVSVDTTQRQSPLPQQQPHHQPYQPPHQQQQQQQQQQQHPHQGQERNVLSYEDLKRTTTPPHQRLQSSVGAPTSSFSTPSSVQSTPRSSAQASSPAPISSPTLGQNLSPLPQRQSSSPQTMGSYGPETNQVETTSTPFGQLATEINGHRPDLHQAQDEDEHEGGNKGKVDHVHEAEKKAHDNDDDEEEEEEEERGKGEEEEGVLDLGEIELPAPIPRIELFGMNGLDDSGIGSSGSPASQRSIKEEGPGEEGIENQVSPTSGQGKGTKAMQAKKKKNNRTSFMPPPGSSSTGTGAQSSPPVSPKGIPASSNHLHGTSSSSRRASLRMRRLSSSLERHKGAAMNGGTVSVTGIPTPLTQVVDKMRQRQHQQHLAIQSQNSTSGGAPGMDRDLATSGSGSSDPGFSALLEVPTRLVEQLAGDPRLQAEMGEPGTGKYAVYTALLEMGRGLAGVKATVEGRLQQAATRIATAERARAAAVREVAYLRAKSQSGGGHGTGERASPHDGSQEEEAYVRGLEGRLEEALKTVERLRAEARVSEGKVTRGEERAMRAERAASEAAERMTELESLHTTAQTEIRQLLARDRERGSSISGREEAVAREAREAALAEAESIRSRERDRWEEERKGHARQLESHQRAVSSAQAAVRSAGERAAEAERLWEEAAARASGLESEVEGERVAAAAAKAEASRWKLRAAEVERLWRSAKAEVAELSQVMSVGGRSGEERGEGKGGRGRGMGEDGSGDEDEDDPSSRDKRRQELERDWRDEWERKQREEEGERRKQERLEAERELNETRERLEQERDEALGRAMDAEKSWAGAQRELTALRRRSMAKHDATAYLRSQLAAADETVRLREREAEEAEVRVQTLLAHLEGTSSELDKIRNLSDRLSYLTVENQRLRQTLSQSGDGTGTEGMDRLGGEAANPHEGSVDYM